jgi:co-chaperonin GroES (HSP10)
MKLKEKVYTPVASSIWIDVDLEESYAPGKIILPNNTVLPPFIEANVLAVGPKCVQIKKGDRVLLNTNAVMKIKVGGEDTQFFTLEDRVVAVLTDPFDSDPV